MKVTMTMTIKSSYVLKRDMCCWKQFCVEEIKGGVIEPVALANRQVVGLCKRLDIGHMPGNETM